jgi:uncharacterized protein
MVTFPPLAGVLLLGLLSGCKEAKQVADLATTMADARAKGPMHQRLKWRTEDFFADASVVALCKAIEARDIEGIKRVVKSGVDVNAKGRGNMTPLLWAFPMGEDVFGTLLDLGADPNVKLTEDILVLSKGESVVFASVELVDGLIYSQFFYDVPMDNYLKLVLAHRGNPNQEDTRGYTPLFCVKTSARRLREKIELLLKAGADINHKDHQGETPLVGAVAWRKDYLLCLLEAGADYRIADNRGWDLILGLASLTMPQGPGGQVKSRLDQEVARAQPVFDWLNKEGVSWDAARAALRDANLIKNLKHLPADYKHRPWLPQRPTLKKS